MELIDIVLIPGLQMMNLVYRVTTVDNLDMIWNMFKDQILDQRLTQAIALTNFAHSLGLHPEQLYVQFMVDEKQYLQAKAELMPPLVHSRSSLLQGLPIFDSLVASNFR